MVGAPDVVQPWMPRAARDSDAWLCHVSIAGGARRRGCAAAGVSGFLDGPLAERLRRVAFHAGELEHAPHRLRALKQREAHAVQLGLGFQPDGEATPRYVHELQV